VGQGKEDSASMSGHDHSHSHGDEGGHGHAGAPAGRNEGRLLLAFVLTLGTLLVEAVGGWVSGSLALLADAGHMLVDALALLFAWAGAHFARRPADARRSFGYARLEVLVGYTNALAQFALVAWILFEAAQRLLAPAAILSGTMLVVALFGLAVNVLVLRVLHVHHDEDINLAGARLHVLGDLLGSVGAVAAALAIRYLDWGFADPAISVLVSLLLLRSAWRLLRRSGHILLEGAPAGVESQVVAAALAEAGIGVRDVHHVHVWELAGGASLATLHARVEGGIDTDQAIAAIQRVLGERFGIAHATVQIDHQGCGEAPCARSG
jgi:cobalt-zinc-cadmium efflux system protein